MLFSYGSCRGRWPGREIGNPGCESSLCQALTTPTLEQLPFSSL